MIYGAKPVQPVSQKTPEIYQDPSNSELVNLRYYKPQLEESSIDPLPYFSEDPQYLPMFDV